MPASEQTQAAAFQSQAPSQGLSATRSLSRILGMWDLVLLIVGTVIGSGIFLVPGAVLRPVGNSVPVALSVWLVGGLLSLLGALTCGELTAMKPEAGGLYVYIRDCFGPLPSFLFGWTFFFVISTGSVGGLSAAFSVYVTELIPLNHTAQIAVAFVVIAIIAAVNVLGTRQSANVQNLTTGIKVAAILAMTVTFLWLGKGFHGFAASTATPLSFGAMVSGAGVALLSVLWAYDGWQYAACSAGEALNPQRNFPLAFLVGTSAVIAIYIFANVGYVSALGAEGVAHSDRVATTALGAVLNPAAAKLVTIAILISIISAANSIMLTSTRVFYAMAKDGVFFKKLAEVHPRFGTPAFAVIAAAIWAAVLVATGTFEQLLTWVIFAGWSFYALVAASVFVYRRREPEAVRPYRVPGYPFTPLVFILVIAVFVVIIIFSQPARAAAGLGLVATGVPAFLIWRRRVVN
jgi:basic amino acid/polyamine antiporter, APA family